MGAPAGELRLNYRQLMFGGITVRGNFMYDVVAPTQLVKMVSAGVLRLDQLQVRAFAFESIEDAIEHSARGRGLEEVTVLLPASES